MRQKTISIIRLKTHRILHPVELVLLFICCVSISSIFLLAIQKFSSINSLVIGLLLFVVSFRIWHFKIEIKDNRFGKGILFVIFIAILFRVPPYLYLSGGQDQGSYISMSKEYEKTGGLYFTDELRQSLTPEQKEIYDRNWTPFLAGEETAYEAEETGESKYIMPFYPLHPAWMAISGRILGEDNRVYSLTMFSILSVIGFYLLGYEIAGRKKIVGLISSLLTAVNPLHAFFSKYPASEMVALSFTCLGFYYLIRYYNDTKKGRSTTFNLFLSVLLMNCFMYARMSFFMYIPFFYIVSVLIVLFVNKKRTRKYLLIYLVSLLLLYLISVFFYSRCMPELFQPIYRAYIVRKLGSDWQNVLTRYSILAIVTLILLTYTTKIKVVKKIFYNLAKYSWLLLPAVIFYLLYFSYIRLQNLGFSDAAIGTFNDTIYNMVGHEWGSAKFLSLFITMLYITPLGFIMIPVSTFYFRNKNPVFSILVFFTLLFTAYTTIYVRYSQYHFYCTRYYISEIVPYALLVISVFLGSIIQNKRYRIISLIFIFTIILYSTFFTAIQLRGQEGPETRFYNDINESVMNNDLIIILRNYGQYWPLDDKKYSYWPSNEVIFPLKHYYNIDVFNVFTKEDIINEDMISLYERYDYIYLLSVDKLDETNNLSYQKTLRLKHGFFSDPIECTNHTYSFMKLDSYTEQKIPEFYKCLIPTTHYVGYKDIHMYKIINGPDIEL